MSAPTELPRWADVGLIPIINVLAALVVSGTKAGAGARTGLTGIRNRHQQAR